METRMTIKFSDITGGGIPYGNTAGRPANPGIGKLYSNGETARLELYTQASGWQNIVQETPGVSSITGSYSEATNSGTIAIAGTNFVSGAYASAIGTNGVEIQATSTTYNSLVSLTAIFTGLSNQYEPYGIKVTNPSNLFGLLPNALYVNASPVWITAYGSLGTFTEQVSISVTATATDSDSQSITYSLASGSSLPSGLSLSSSGTISGTLPDITTNTTYSFTINATDGLNTIPRTFSITSNTITPTLDYLLVGGGGSGGWDVGGGGGAGGLLTGTYTLSGTRQFAIAVGAGGQAITTNSEQFNGGNTTAFGLIAYGGGGGGNWNNSANSTRNGAAGGSGGGGGGWSQIGYGGAGTSGQGYAGGNATTNSAPSYGGGGGGAGGPGSNGTAGDNSQIAGGPGVASSITGTSIVYAAGGKGGGDSTSDSLTVDGTDGLGNGGDGQGQTAKRRGGSGVAVIAYSNTYPPITNIPGTLTYDTPTRSGYRVYRFTAGSGTITF